MLWRPAMPSLFVRLSATALAAGMVLAVGAGNAAANGFSPSAPSLVLCAYTGTPPGTPCSNQNLTVGANADMTLVVSNPSGSVEPGLSVTFLPAAVTIRGPETNQLCGDSTDSDGDGYVNDGCPAVGVSAEQGAQCSNSVDDDADTLVNDGCPSAGAPPVGAVAGKAYVAGKFGALNAPCDQDFSSTAGAWGYPYLMNATVDNRLPMEYSSLPPGSIGSEGPLEFFRDDGNGNGLPRHVDRYPSFLNRIFDPDRVGDINGDGDEFDYVVETDTEENPGASPADWYGRVEPIRPVARYTISWFVSTQAQLLQILVFSPGALAAFDAPHPLSGLGDPALGYVVVAIMGDPTHPPGPSDVTDFCSPSETMVMLWGKTRDNPCTGGTCPNSDTPCYFGCGSNGCINLVVEPSPSSCPPVDESLSGTCLDPSTYEGNCVRYANPPTAGTHLFNVYQQSQRDADNDGKENTLDTCPLTYDTLDARTGVGPDIDSDRIPEVAGSCDTVNDPPTGNEDQDGDGFKNTQDNCPIVWNPDQKESETVTPYASAAKRGGSRADGIGDACDPNPTKADGHFHTVLTVIPKCIGATDSDGDGWCASDDPDDGNASRTPETSTRVLTMWMANWGSGDSPPRGEPIQLCNDGFDNDGDGYVDMADSGCTPVDIDGDGFSYSIEAHVYGPLGSGAIATAALTPCDMAGAPVEPNAFWPGDLAGTGISGTGGANRVTLQDVTSYTTPAASKKFGQNPGGPFYNVRWDINPASPQLNLADITTLTAGGNGSAARPPFYSHGVYAPNSAPKAFGNPTFCNYIFKP